MALSWRSRYSRGLTPILKKPRAAAYVMLILSLLTAAFFGLFAIKPTLVTISRLMREIKDGKEIDAKLSQKINALTTLDQQYRALENDLIVVETALPTKPEFDSILAQLEKVANENQVELSTVIFQPLELATARQVNLRPPTAKIGFTLTPIAFKASFVGEYQNLTATLASLYQLKRLTTLKALTISPTREGEGLILHLTGEGYYVH